MRDIQFAWIAVVGILIGCSNPAKKTYTTASSDAISLVNKNVGLMWLAPDCPLCQNYTTEFVKISKDYTPDMTFYGVLAGNQYSKAEIDHFVDSFDFDLPIILDKEYELTTKFNATVTPEFFIIDSNFITRFQGRFDNWAIDLGQKRLKPSKFYYNDALDSFVKGLTISNSYVEPIGCVIELD